jgi:hypothetical protein
VCAVKKVIYIVIGFTCRGWEMVFLGNDFIYKPLYMSSSKNDISLVSDVKR